MWPCASRSVRGGGLVLELPQAPAAEAVLVKVLVRALEADPAVSRATHQ